MSCHFSCSSGCSGPSFTSCLTCSGSASLVNSACFCSSDWNSSCTSNAALQPIYTILQSFYMVLFPMLMFLFCLKVKLHYSYRLVVGLQGFSLLVFSNQLYLYFQNQFGLTFLAKSNGSFNFSNRLQSLSIDFAIGPFVLFGCFLVGYFTLYPLTLTFCKQYNDYQEYLMNNWVYFIYSFFFFSSKMIFYYIGLWINFKSTEIAVIIPFCLFAAIVVGVLVKLFYDFHQNNLSEEEVYEPQLYLYSMLSSIPMLGIPLVSSTTMYSVVYLSPLGLLILIMLLNKGYEICSKTKVIFYVIEIAMAGLTVGFVMVGDPYRSYILLGTIALSILVIIVQMSALYYSGIELKRSPKVHPETGTSQETNSLQGEQDRQGGKKQKNPKKGVKKNPYF